MTQTTCPSFIDLAAFAQTAPRSGTPITLPLRSAPVVVQAAALEGHGETQTLAGDTFLIVAQGTITLNDQPLAKGQAIVLSGAQTYRWTASAPARIITMRYTGGTSTSTGTGLTRVDPTTPRAPSGAPLAELLIGPTPQCHNHTQFLSSDGEYMVGVWDSSPYHRRAMAYRHFELMYLLKGSVTFIDELGHQATFREGDLFLVEQHAQCSWESREDVTKIFAIYRPAA